MSNKKHTITSHSVDSNLSNFKKKNLKESLKKNLYIHLYIVQLLSSGRATGSTTSAGISLYKSI